MTPHIWIIEVNPDLAPEPATPSALARRLFTLMKERSYRMALLAEDDDDGVAELDHRYAGALRDVAHRLTVIRSSDREVVFEKLRVFEALAEDYETSIPDYAWDLFGSAKIDLGRWQPSLAEAA